MAEKRYTPESLAITFTQSQHYIDAGFPYRLVHWYKSRIGGTWDSAETLGHYRTEIDAYAALERHTLCR